MYFSIKKILIALPMAVLILCAGLTAQNKDFSSYCSDVLAIDAKPKSHFQETRLFIIHPMVKEKETIYHHFSKLTWKGNKVTRTYTGFKIIKGRKPRGNTGVGKTYKTQYIPDGLRKFCSSKSISKWEKKESVKLGNEKYMGYSFLIKIKGENKDGLVYLSPDGSLKAMSLGFPDSGLSHEKNMKENATVWYFEGSGDNLRLTKVRKYTVEKKGSIPVITTVTSKFSEF